jgi:hypothetical protein
MLMAITFVAGTFATGGIAASGAVYRNAATDLLQEHHLPIGDLLCESDDLRHLEPEVLSYMQKACESSFGKWELTPKS